MPMRHYSDTPTINATLCAVLLLLAMYSHAAQTQTQTKVVVIPLLGDDAPMPIKYKIGDTGPAGGIVFHVTNEGLNGLEAAPVDQAENVRWGCLNSNVDGVIDVAPTSPDPNSGAANTPLIAVQCPQRGSLAAAVFAAVYVWPNGQIDGFLPNKEELNLLYAQRNIVEGFFPELGSSDRFYWSSSESSDTAAWLQDFRDGFINSGTKDRSDRVRAIRAF